MDTVRVFVGRADDLDKGCSRRVDIMGIEIALFRNDDGEFYATADSCSHEQWSLGEDGDLDRNEVTCPLHMARFDIRTGAVLCFPATEPLASYPVEVGPEGDVHIIVPARHA